jgi:hypothetical protein
MDSNARVLHACCTRVRPHAILITRRRARRIARDDDNDDTTALAAHRL